MAQLPAPVLLVDSNRDGLELYATALALEGIRSDIASSASEAFERLRDHCPRVLVTELRLPGTTGTTLIERVRRNAPASELFIVGLTTNHRKESPEARAAGCDVVLAKPCLPATLLEELRRVLP